jgi:two-component system OmpR family response regulator
VRALLVEDRGRPLPFLGEVCAVIADDVETQEVDDDAVQRAAQSNAELVVIARSTWEEKDTALCSSLYGARLGAPILAVSGPCAPDLRAACLRAGADEFISVPFDIEELVARAFALVRRAASGRRLVRAGPFLLDLARRQVFVDGNRVALTLSEFDILAALMERPGEVVPRKELAARTGSVAGRASNIVDVHVSRIRDALGRRAPSVETVRGLGYRFRADRA